MKMQTGDTRISRLKTFRCRQNTPTVMLQLILFRTEAWNTEVKKVLQHHIFFLFATQSQSFVCSKRRKDNEILKGLLCLRILAALPCQLLSQPFFLPHGCGIFLLKVCMLIVMVYSAGVKIKGSPNQTGSFLLRPPFWSPGKKAYFLSLTCWIKIEKQIHKVRK